MKKILSVLLLLIIMSCSKNYKIDFLPPPQTSTVDMLFPLEIESVKRVPSIIEFDQGIAFNYFNLGTIWIYSSPSEDDAKLYFDNKIINILNKKYKNITNKNIGNQKLIVISENNTEIVCWTNKNWLFMIKSSNKESLDSIIKNCKYIKN